MEEEEEINDGWWWWRLAFFEIELYKGFRSFFFVRWLVYPFDKGICSANGCNIYS